MKPTLDLKPLNRENLIVYRQHEIEPFVGHLYTLQMLRLKEFLFGFIENYLADNKETIVFYLSSLKNQVLFSVDSAIKSEVRQHLDKYARLNGYLVLSSDIFKMDELQFEPIVCVKGEFAIEVVPEEISGCSIQDSAAGYGSNLVILQLSIK